MPKHDFRRLSPKEFDAALLEKLTREGRVYIYSPKEIDKDACKCEILAYTQAIECFASETWSDGIKELWLKIVREDSLLYCLIMKNGLQAGHMNRYVVTNLVCRLQNAGVYRQDVSMLQLHRRLEGISTKNRYYKSNGNYDLSREARVILRKIISESKKSKI